MRTTYVLGVLIAAAVLASCQQKQAALATEPGAAAAPAAGDPELPDPPGDGSIRCPGNESCPTINLNNTAINKGFGIAGKELVAAPNGAPRQLICTGVAATSDPGCPDGYVGRLLLASTFEADGLQTPVICRRGESPCQPETWAIVCTNGKKGCPMYSK